MSALQHYLFEEDLKAGDTGAAARIAAEKEAERLRKIHEERKTKHQKVRAMLLENV